jgi:hypothetical protein
MQTLRCVRCGLIQFAQDSCRRCGSALAAAAVVARPAMSPGLGASSPWRAAFTMWTSPRDTIRAIVHDDPSQWVILLAWLLGVSSLLLSASSRDLDDKLGPLFSLFLGVYMGPLVGMGQVYIAGAFAHWVGRLFGSDASEEECRAALAWGAVPSVWGLMLWVVGLAVFGERILYAQDDSGEPVPPGVLAFTRVQYFLGVCTLILQFGALAAVHGFTLRRAFAAALVAWVVVIAAFVGLLS